MVLLGIHDPRKHPSKRELCERLAIYAFAVWRNST